MNSNFAPVLLLVGAIGTGGGMAFLANNYVENQIEAENARLKAEYEGRYQGIRVIVPRGNYAAGVVLSIEMLSAREVPKTFLPEDAITEDQLDRILGAALLTSVAGGAPLLFSHITQGKADEGFANYINAGQRALTFPVDSVSSISGLIAPRDRIDLIVTIREGNDAITKTLLENVLVLATDRITGGAMNKAGRDLQTITLLVSPENASRIILTREIGTLTAILRAPTDTATNPDWANKELTKEAILGKKEIRKPDEAPTIPIIRGGK